MWKKALVSFRAFTWRPSDRIHWFVMFRELSTCMIWSFQDASCWYPCAWSPRCRSTFKVIARYDLFSKCEWCFDLDLKSKLLEYPWCREHAFWAGSCQDVEHEYPFRAVTLNTLTLSYRIGRKFHCMIFSGCASIRMWGYVQVIALELSHSERGSSLFHGVICLFGCEKHLCHFRKLTSK